MKWPVRVRSALRVSALLVLLTGALLWVGTGAHVGWTQTSTVTMLRDEITGIEYPERRDTFVAGVEVPLLAAGLAGLLAGASFLVRRPSLVRT